MGLRRNVRSCLNLRLPLSVRKGNTVCTNEGPLVTWIRCDLQQRNIFISGTILHHFQALGGFGMLPGLPGVCCTADVRRIHPFAAWWINGCTVALCPNFSPPKKKRNLTNPFLFLMTAVRWKDFNVGWKTSLLYAAAAPSPGATTSHHSGKEHVMYVGCCVERGLHKAKIHRSIKMFLSILCYELVPLLGFKLRGMNANGELAESIAEKPKSSTDSNSHCCLFYRRWNDLLNRAVIIAWFT